MHTADAPLLIIALIVFGGIYVYLMGIDARMRRLERELDESRDRDGAE